ncbi:MAG: DUF2249 domain-containing protein [Firmicutes bacterium]|nr:DUF2249 domain-containing protein [Bacillota bacterium]MCL5039675.1 DUF2249 domain-containing protein [Bacillota bacterium]
MPKEIELDVRSHHARGVDPFDDIMKGVKELSDPGDTLVLINTFEPFRLYGVMEGRGFQHEAEKMGEGHWRIVFRKL